jgi:hypothetical protein
MFLVQLLVFFKKKSLAEHAPQATSKIIEAFFDKASVGLPQPGDLGGDFSIAGQKLPVDASRRADSEYNLQSQNNLH